MFVLKRLLLVCLLVLASCKTDSKKEIKTDTIAFTKEGNLSIWKMQSDSTKVDLDIEISETEYETQTGLMYRPSMEKSQGMLFIFPNVGARSFYMKNTEFPLDIIYIGENQKIVSFQKNAKPYDETSLPSDLPAKYVLEINAGLSDQWGLQVGDSISYTRN
ncbi:DUF192 domain-containing protein [Flagellimonas pelagia]|uniref:DUF192 domain-containing protein n=1 Tax=Flagellimonas pelagia TaxID=2306998 RepID=A0A3A1NNT3_9FLAO|nr:DUF192 domain-containing protein [Allomuricauda maritima]RIV46934.1 DUF192 domain-containing protein [Allomuricauda maritima]TXJ99824.1 DUF192 domain-containing protein [Allomuricauda maritima]